ncbi:MULTISPECIES: hypothetical protein [Streptomyces]|uniref:hypothetical protein n=1 Tax=Streptomyces TaxID=1883 RepID=UPI002887A544|nr:hypothetical protein [Streptomyces sp. DSM 41859]MDT0422185.1 hypothetical protein [Streptomyces sp. DSM 41859]
MSSHPNPATEREPGTAVGEPKGAARKGAVVALRPKPRPSGQRYQVGGLHVLAPPRKTPRARSWCVCGRDRTAIGTTAVLALVAEHTEHRTTCPRLHRATEGRAAA